jgi:hypothetical protein
VAHPNSLKNLKPFKPGHVGGPGVVRLPPELRQARRENMAVLIQLIHKYVGMTEEQAKVRLNGPESLQIEEMIQGQINKAKEGDSNAFKFIIEIMCGKIPEADENRSAAENMTRQEKLEAARMMVKLLEEEPNGSSDPGCPS